MDFLYYICIKIMKEDTLIKLNPEFHQECIFDFSEYESKLSKYNSRLCKGLTPVKICDGVHYTYVDYDDLEYNEIEELGERYSSIILYYDWKKYEDNLSERFEINNRRIEDFERYDNYIDGLNRDLIYFHEKRMNKIFSYINKKY